MRRPAVELWKARCAKARSDYEKSEKLYEHAKSVGDATCAANSESEMKEAKLEFDVLVLFKGDLVSFARYDEFMSHFIARLNDLFVTHGLSDGDLIYYA